MTVYCTRLEADVATIARDTAHRDTKGRVIGGRVRISTDTFEVAPEANRGGWTYAQPGDVRFAYTPSATRDGKDYGASQSRVSFLTAAERDAAVEKYFAGMAKRAAKAAEKAGR